MVNNIIVYVNYHFPNYKTNDYNDCFIKSCLVYRYLHEEYFKKNNRNEQNYLQTKQWFN